MCEERVIVTCRYIIHVNDIACIIPGKLDFNNVCTVGLLGLFLIELDSFVVKVGRTENLCF